MIIVDIYSKPDCHLCDVAKETLRKAQVSHPFELHEHDIRNDERAFELYKERIPVILINKKFAFQYRVVESEFLSLLREEQASIA